MFSGKVGMGGVGSYGRNRITGAVIRSCGKERIRLERLFMAVHETVLKCCVWHSVVLEGSDNVIPERGSRDKGVQDGGGDRGNW